MTDACEVQKRALNSLELELHTAPRSHSLVIGLKCVLFRTPFSVSMS